MYVVVSLTRCLSNAFCLFAQTDFEFNVSSLHYCCKKLQNLQLHINILGGDKLVEQIL